jgi:hypothetical protein
MRSRDGLTELKDGGIVITLTGAQIKAQIERVANLRPGTASDELVQDVANGVFFMLATPEANGTTVVQDMLNEALCDVVMAEVENYDTAN